MRINHATSAQAESVKAAYGMAKTKNEVNATEASQPVKGVQIDQVHIQDGISAQFITHTLMTKIGSKIEAMLDKAGIDPEDYAGVDMSAEATSDRIVSFSTAFFGLYRQQHEEMSDEEAITGFENLVRTAVDDGAREALQMLATFDLEQEAKPLAQQTMDLVHTKLDDFFADLRNSYTQPEATTGD